jgi:hypothetical protein
MFEDSSKKGAWGDLTSLDLSDVEAQESRRLLEPGEHRVKITSAKVEKMNNGNGAQLLLEFTSMDGHGSIRQWLNLWHSSSEAQRIARSQLKSLLICSGHPDPDKPGGVEEIMGSELSVVVGMSKRKTVGNKVYEPKAEVKAYLTLGEDPLDDAVNF